MLALDWNWDQYGSYAAPTLNDAGIRGTPRSAASPGPATAATPASRLEQRGTYAFSAGVELLGEICLDEPLVGREVVDDPVSDLIQDGDHRTEVSGAGDRPGLRGGSG
ncbi:MAG: hypothetical protein ABIS86_07000 [Streptosporangiaceae bacterium]